MLISRFHLIHGTTITPPKFFVDLGLECTQIHRLAQYTILKWFTSRDQSAAVARRVTDESPPASIVVETMKLLAKSSNGYQILDRRRHTSAKHVNDEKTHKATKNKFFRKLISLNDNLNKVQSVKTEVEHKELGLLTLQHAKLPMVELLYNFFQKILWLQFIRGNGDGYKFFLLIARI